MRRKRLHRVRRATKRNPPRFLFWWVCRRAVAGVIPGRIEKKWILLPLPEDRPPQRVLMTRDDFCCSSADRAASDPVKTGDTGCDRGEISPSRNALECNRSDLDIAPARDKQRRAGCEYGLRGTRLGIAARFFELYGSRPGLSAALRRLRLLRQQRHLRALSDHERPSQRDRALRLMGGEELTSGCPSNRSTIDCTGLRYSSCAGSIQRSCCKAPSIWPE